MRPGQSFLDLVRVADIALYEAKRGGRNRVAAYVDGDGSSDQRSLFDAIDPLPVKLRLAITG